LDESRSRGWSKIRFQLDRFVLSFVQADLLSQSETYVEEGDGGFDL
jgi:hypothetical protein